MRARWTATMLLVTLMAAAGAPAVDDDTSEPVPAGAPAALGDTPDRSALAPGEDVRSGSRGPNDWAMFRGDTRRTGNSSTTPPAGNTEAWKTAVGSNYVYSSPTIYGDHVYVGANNGFYCLYLSNGTQNWKATVYTNTFTSSACVVGDRIYVGANSGRLYCLNASTGAQVWNYNTGSAVESSPVVVGSSVYVANNIGRLYSITTSGSHNWDIQISTSDVSSSPAYWNDRIYIGSGAHHDPGNYLLCVNATTGAYIWNHTANNDIVSTPAVGYGNVYFVSESGTAYCVDAQGNGDGTTDLIWTHGSGGSSSQGSGALVNGYYIYGNGASGGGSVTSVDAYGDGMGGTTQRWTQPHATSGKFGFLASIAVAGGQVFGGHGDGTLYCFDELNGSQLWSYASGIGGYGIDGGPSVSKGYCIIGGDDGWVYCVGGPVIPPVVESVSPTDGSVGVALDTGVTATFDLDMIPALLTTTSFTFVDSLDQPVTGAVTYSAATKTVTFTHDADLAEGEIYTATILGTIEDELGIGLDGDGDGEAEGSPADDYTWSFTTVELNAPAMSAIPVQEPVEDEEHMLDLDTYVSDADTPLSELVLSHNSSYVEDESGFVLTFLYPEGVLWEDVNITVSDGTKETWQTVRFDVSPVNDPPQLGVMPPRSATEDVEGRIDISSYISDVDTPVDAGHFTVEEDSAHVEVDGLELVYTYPEGVLAETFNVTITDGGVHTSDASETAEGTLTINVQPVNDPPYLRNPGDQTVDQDQLLEVAFEVIDPDDDEFTFDVEAADAGTLLPYSLEMDDDTMTLSVTPTNDEVGLWNLTVTVEDSGRDTDTVSLSVTVVNVNDPPPASAIRHTAVDAWPETPDVAENLTLTFACDEVVDIDGDALTYLWDFDAADGADDAVTGLAVEHTYPFGGEFTVTLTVDDGSGGTAVTRANVTAHPVPETDGDGGEPGDGGEDGGEVDGGDGGVPDGGDGTDGTDGDDQPPGKTGGDTVDNQGLSSGAALGIVAAIAALIAIVALLLVMKGRKKSAEPDNVREGETLDLEWDDPTEPVPPPEDAPPAAPFASPAGALDAPPPAAPLAMPVGSAPPAALAFGEEPPMALPPEEVDVY